MTTFYEDPPGAEEALESLLVQFFESGDLYREYAVPGTEPAPYGQSSEDAFEVPTSLRIQLPCPSCEGVARTFAVAFEPKQMEHSSVDFEVGESYMVRFGCTHCRGQRYAFLVHVGRTTDTRGLHVVKAGVWPSAQPAPSPELSHGLGAAAHLFGRGLTVEKFGFGIGAFAYYRRVTEDIIGRLLADLRTYAEEAELSALVDAVDKTAAEHQAANKIAIVKDLVPKMLRPAGRNPLGTLYAALSEGIHGGSEDECLDRAAALRIAIEFLVTKLESLVATPKQFVEAMQKLQAVEEKKAKKATKPPK
jgi:hypothetical protein